MIITRIYHYRKLNDEKMATYKDFVKSLDERTMESCLMSDLKLCQEDDVRLFTYLMPDIYSHVSISRRRLYSN